MFPAPSAPVAGRRRRQTDRHFSRLHEMSSLIPGKTSGRATGPFWTFTPKASFAFISRTHRGTEQRIINNNKIPQSPLYKSSALMIVDLVAPLKPPIGMFFGGGHLGDKWDRAKLADLSLSRKCWISSVRSDVLTDEPDLRPSAVWVRACVRQVKNPSAQNRSSAVCGGLSTQIRLFICWRCTAAHRLQPGGYCRSGMTMRKHAGTVYISGCHITETPEEENATNSKDVKKKNTTNIYIYLFFNECVQASCGVCARASFC